MSDHLDPSDLHDALSLQDHFLKEGKQLLSVTDWRTPMLEPVPDWLIPGLLQESALHVLSSDTGCCKTWLALSLMLSGLYGIPVLDQRPVRPFSSLYLAADSPSWDIGQQLRKLKQAHNLPDSASSEVNAFVMPIGFLLDREDHVNFIQKFCASWQIDVFFIDVMLYAHTGDENDNGFMARSVLRAAKWLRDHGIAVYFLHHNAKPSMNNPNPTARGAGTIIQAAEHHHPLTKRRDIITLSVDKIRGTRVIPDTISFSLTERNGGAYLKTTSDTSSSGDLILNALAAGPLSRDALSRELPGWAPRAIDNHLQYLRKKELIVSTPRGWTLCNFQSQTSSPS